MPASSRRSCDICRKRKTKCLPVSEDDSDDAPCANCSRLNIECTYTYIYKRPGRPSLSAGANLHTHPHDNSDKPASISPPDRQPSLPPASLTGYPGGPEHLSPSSRSHGHPDAFTPSLPYSDLPPPPGMADSMYQWSSAEEQLAFAHPSHSALTDLSHLSSAGLLPSPPLQNSIAPMASHAAFAHQPPPHPPAGMASAQPPDWQTGQSPGQLGSETERSHSRGSGSAQNASGSAHNALQSYQQQTPGGPPPGAAAGPRPSQAFYIALRSPDLQIDDVSDWNTISFFTSVFLRFNHSLCPLVHTPSFARALATRRDKHDRQFRAFVLGLVTYTIGQSPVGRLTEVLTRQQLEKLQENCHRASMLLHDRRYAKPSLHHIGTLICGYFFCQSNSYVNEAGALLAEACQVSHQMRLHDDSATQLSGADFCEINLRKRVFWYLYAIDVTDACAGLPIHLHEFEGFPSFPLEASDELITSEGAFPQPLGRVSAMTGFVVCVKLFAIIAGCLVRRRGWGRRQPTLLPLDADEAIGWISQAEQQVNALVEGLPPVLAFVNPAASHNEDDNSFYGMQRANLVITALSARFLLCSYKNDVQPHNLLISRERDALSQEGIRTLASIPMDDLAANGESMRGKIFRILLMLLDRPSNEGFWDGSMQDWWNMYTNIQFVQLVIPQTQSILPSREVSPS